MLSCVLPATMDKLSTQKNPLELLHDLKPDINYVLQSSGPDFAKNFTASVDFEGNTYSAEGSSKKKAKINVASMIVKSLPVNSELLMKNPQHKVCFPKMWNNLCQMFNFSLCLMCL